MSQRGLTVVTERNTHHPGKPTGADHVVIRPFGTYDAWIDAMRDGTIDVAFVMPDEVAALSLPTERFARSPVDAISYLELNQSIPALANADVRQALSMAIDRDALMEVGLPGDRAATGFVPEAQPGARTDACVSCVYNPDVARRKLADAGVVPATMTIKLGAYHEARAERIANMWRANLGITVVIDNDGGDPGLVDANLSSRSASKHARSS